MIVTEASDWLDFGSSRLAFQSAITVLGCASYTFHSIFEVIVVVITNKISFTVYGSTKKKCLTNCRDNESLKHTTTNLTVP